MQNQFCTLNGSLVRSDHWYDHENCLNYPNDLKKPCGAIGDILTQKVDGVDVKHCIIGGFCMSCRTKFGKNVLQLYDESELIKGEKSLNTFFKYLKPLLFMESMTDIDYDRLRRINPNDHQISSNILETIEAKKNLKK